MDLIEESEQMLLLHSDDYHVVESDEKGKCLYTSRRYGKGEVIYLFDYWSEKVTPMHITNHSCEPSASFNEEGELIALRDLEKDEEVTFNYLHHPTPASPWNFECHCKSRDCVGRVIAKE